LISSDRLFNRFLRRTLIDFLLNMEERRIRERIEGKSIYTLASSTS